MQTENTNNYTLTKYPEAGMRELLAIAMPLILTATSASIMMFVDRIILANYNIEAVNAAATASVAFAVYQYGAIGIAAIAEVFVGQYNGARRYSQIGEPVWQMVWFSLLTLVFLIPFGLFGAQHVIPPNYHELGLPYFYWLIYMGPVFPMAVAFASFFIGRGKTRLVLAVSIVINIINIVLDYILVFGIEDIIPSLGTAGAAIATVIAQLVAVVVYAIIFLKHKNRIEYGTNRYQFKWAPFYQCLKIGVPGAAGLMIAIAAWTFLFYMMGLSSPAHITVFALGQSIYLLFIFVEEGMYKATMAIIANYIGANKIYLVKKFLFSVAQLLVAFALLIAIPLLIYPGSLLNVFFFLQDHVTINMDIYNDMVVSLRWLWAIIMIDASVRIFAGILTAGGDTKFVMYLFSVATWLFGVIPVYIFIFHFDGTAVDSWRILTVHSLITFGLFYWRYRIGRWKEIEVIKKA